VIPDIERNGYCFTDGCGFISQDLANKLAPLFGFSQASAFQIRLGGCKGVLVVNKDLKGEKV
jgi:RNA-dependent RNA polymerase